MVVTCKIRLSLDTRNLIPVLGYPFLGDMGLYSSVLRFFKYISILVKSKESAAKLLGLQAAEVRVWGLKRWCVQT